MTTALPASDSPGTKVCTDCLQVLPISQFRRRKVGDDERRAPQCGKCFAAYMRGWRRAKKDRRLGRFFSQVKHARTGRAVERLVAMTVHEVGGFGELAKAFGRQIVDPVRDIEALRRGGIALETLGRLWKLADEQRDQRERDEFDGLSDEDLQLLFQTELAAVGALPDFQYEWEEDEDDEG